MAHEAAGNEASVDDVDVINKSFITNINVTMEWPSDGRR